MINVKKLPSVLLSDLHTLPTDLGVYFALDSANRIWYIGGCKNIRKALKNHSQIDNFLDNEVTKIAYLIIDDYQQQKAELINYFAPPLNSKDDYSLPYVEVDNLNPQECFERYCEIKELIKTLEEEVEKLKPNVITFIEENANDGKKYTNKNICAWITNRAYYEHSQAIKDMEKELKKAKKNEISSGIAQVKSYTTYPTIKSL